MPRLREPIRKVVRSNGTVRYQARVDIGRGVDGQRLQRKSTFATRREAREWLATVVDERTKGTLVAPSRLTVGQLLDEWLEGKRDLRPSTRRTYVDALKPVRQKLGDRPVQRLTKADLDQLVSQMAEGGGRHGGGRGARTVTITLNVLQQALNDAAQQGLVVRNVASLVQRPRQAHLEMTTWTLAEIRRFEQAVADERLRVAWLLTILGLRRGEVLGLRWKDVSPERSELRIRQTRVPVSGQGVVISEPKTTRGRRVLPLDPYLVEALREFRALREREAAVLGQELDAADVIVVDELGSPIPPDKYSKMFRALTETAHLRRIRLHDVRHTALTLMALNGVPLAVVAAWAGHADPAFTLRVYAHSQDDAIRDASSLLTRMISESL